MKRPASGTKTTRAKRPPNPIDDESNTLTIRTAPRPTKRTGRHLGYVRRVSQRKGREGESFLSPEQQDDLAYGHAKSHGDEITKVYDETDSVSGGTVDREGLQAALRDALGGVTDGIIVAKVNRFARTKRAGEAAIYDLIESGKSFIAAANNIDTAGGKLDRGTEVYLDFLLRQAQWEREDLKANWLDVRQRSISKGIANHAMYGYRKGADKKLVRVPAQEKHVRYIFERRAAGWSWTRIADALNDKGVAPPPPVLRKPYADPEKEAERDPQKIATRWTYSRVRDIVTNRVYLGQLTSGDFVNQKAHEPLVTVELWEKANNVRVTSRHRRKEEAKAKGKPRARPKGKPRHKLPPQEYLLTGLVRCASCGGRMDGETRWVPASATHDGYPVRTYRCRIHQPWGKCPRPARTDAEPLEKLVRDRFEQQFLSAQAGEDVIGADRAELDRAEGELAEAKAVLRGWLTSPTNMALAKELGQSWMDEGTEPRQAAVAEALQRVTDAKATVIGVRLPEGIAEDWKGWTTEQQRLVLDDVFGVVVVAAPALKNARVPVSERWASWWRSDPSKPKLPGVDGVPMEARPIDITAKRRRRKG